MPLDRGQIMAVIPHRDPMLLVDEIVELDPGVRAVGLKHVTDHEFWVAGHYPGMPIMPGVLVLEALAQTGGVAMMVKPELQGKVPLFAGLENVRFRRPVRPGDTLRLEVQITKMRGPIGRGAGRAFVGDELAAEAEVIFALADRDKVR